MLLMEVQVAGVLALGKNGIASELLLYYQEWLLTFSFVSDLIKFEVQTKLVLESKTRF